MSTQPKPHITKVKCIVYWFPDEVADHTPAPGWQVAPSRNIDECDYHGVGLTVKEAWEDYLYWRDV